MFAKPRTCCGRLQDDDRRRSSWVYIFNRRDLILTYWQINFLRDFSNYGNSVMSVIIVVYLLLNWTPSSKLWSHSDPSIIRPDETAFHRNYDFRVSYIFSTLLHHCQNFCGPNFVRPILHIVKHIVHLLSTEKLTTASRQHSRTTML